jgi:hypothetical protein
MPIVSISQSFLAARIGDGRFAADALIALLLIMVLVFAMAALAALAGGGASAAVHDPGFIVLPP